MNADSKNKKTEQCTTPSVISRFSLGDTVRLVSKREFYCSTRVGSRGIIQKSSNSPFGVCHWINFKSHENWIYEEQLDFW